MSQKTAQAPIMQTFDTVIVYGIGAGREGQNTTMFNNVTDYHVTHNTIRFKYISKSTNEQRDAIFYKDNISGVATT